MKSGSNVEKILKAGHFGFTGELGPPRGTNVEAVREKAAPLKGNSTNFCIFFDSIFSDTTFLR